MAGPEVPQHGAINIGYNYTPVRTELAPPIQLPGTGELWANVGKTALAAAQQVGGMLQASPLNPMVREHMNEEIARSKLGEAQMDFARKNPNWMRATVGEGQGGATMVAPITQPVTQQNAWDLDYGGGSGKEKKKEEEPPASTEEPKKKTPNPSPSLNSGMSQVSSPYGGLYASSDQGIPAGYQGEGDAAPPGTPSSMTFLNPATGNIEPLRQGAPPAQPAAPQGGSIWSPPKAPIAPAAPTAQPQPTSQTPAAATQADQASMAKWQEQNAHPVMSSQDALKWAKNQSTLNQDATYLPMGGPNGEPAYAFHVKGGGMNIVPVSQMVQKGAGPMVAAQNTSQVISQTDQAQQPPQNQPNISPPPPANLPQQPQYANISGPPSAPAGPPQVAQAQPPQYPNISGPPPAPTPGAYNAAAYQMPQGPTITQTGNVNPVLMAGGDNQQALQASRDAAKANLPSPTVMEEDAKQPPANRVYNWVTGKDAKGNTVTYADLPDPGGHPFVTQRYYKGNLSGFQPGPQTTENLEKEEIYDEYVGTKGVPLPKDKDGNEIPITYEAIRDFTPEQRRIWLKQARDFYLHPKAPLATDAEGIQLSNAANAIQDAERIRDKLLYMQAHRIPMNTISGAEIIRSQEAGYAKGPAPESWIWDLLSKGVPQNAFADALNGDFQQLNDHLAHTVGGHYEHTAGTPPPEEWGTPRIGEWIPALGFPKTTNVSKIPSLNRISFGDTHEQAISHIQEILDQAKKDYKNIVDKLGPANFRVPDVDAKNLSDLADPKKGYIDDSTNRMRDKNHQLVNGYGDIPRQNKWTSIPNTGVSSAPSASPTPSPTPSASPTPSPTPSMPQISKYDTKEFERLHIKKGDQYLGPDGKTIFTREE